MELIDLLPISEWDALVQDVHEKFGLSCAVSDAQGGHVTHVENWCNRLCPVIKGIPEAIGAICAVAATSFTAQARHTRESVVGECDAGMAKISVPIFLGDEFLGTVGGCGLLMEDGEVEDFMVHKAASLPEEEVAALCTDIPPMTEAQANECAQYMATRIAELVERFQSS